MMASDDDDLTYTSSGDPLFSIDDINEDALPSLLEESNHQKRMSGGYPAVIDVSTSILPSPLKECTDST